jgi:hypothetical protein
LLSPCVDVLEPRQVPTASTSYYANAAAKHAYDRFVSELSRIELNSAATAAQYLALRDDARSISGAVSASGSVAHAPQATDRVVAATLLIDRSLLEGWLGDEGWHEVRGELAADLAPFQVDPSLLDKTVADMKAAATSAAVDPGANQVLIADIASAQSARDQLNRGYGRAPGASYRDPQVYYTQHLRGFFRGWAQQRVADEDKLQADLAATPHGSGGVLGRDVALLERLGAAIPSGADRALTDAYAAALPSGAPDAAGLSAFRTTALAALGGTGNARRVASVDRLISDAPAFAAAAGSTANVRAIIADTRAVTDDGQGASLNPFLIVIFPGVAPAD